MASRSSSAADRVSAGPFSCRSRARSGAAPGRGARQCALQPSVRHETAGSRFGHRLLELARRQERAEVEQGAGGCGHGQARVAPAVSPIERLHPVDTDARTGCRLTADQGDLHPIDRRDRQLPHLCRGGAVTEDRVLPVREQRGGLAGKRRTHAVPHEVDAAMHPVQAPLGDAVSDGAGAQSSRLELRPCDQPALSFGDLRDGPIPGPPARPPGAGGFD